MSNKDIKFAFFGSDNFSIISLNEIMENGFLPEVIISVPDKPKGRKKVITPTPLKSWALEKNIPVLTPENSNDGEFISNLEQLDLDTFIVSSYGKIIPENVLSIPKIGVLNIHPSLLPLWRGATPIEHTILNDDVAGVTIIELDKKMDHGPIIKQKEFSIENPDTDPPTYGGLERQLSKMGGSMISSVLDDYINQKIDLKSQNHSKATFSKILDKNDGKIDLSDNPFKNIRKIRAFEKWPGTFFIHKKGDKEIRVKINKAHIEGEKLVLDRVTPAGKNEMDFESFENGYVK